MNHVKPALTEEDLVKKTWSLLFAGAFAVVGFAFGYSTIEELNPANRDTAVIFMWGAAAAAALPAAFAGWQRRHEKPAPKGHTTNVMRTMGGFAVLISAVFVGLSPSIQSVLLGAGAGFFAGLALGVVPGIAPAWVKKWKRDFS